MSKNILITGGAGYIGSHTVRLLHQQGFNLVVLDNLVYGHPESILSKDIVLINGNVGDKPYSDLFSINIILKRYCILQPMRLLANR